MATYKFKISGFKEVIQRIEKFNKGLGARVGDQLTAGAHNIATNARSQAPTGNSGRLGASISADVSDKFNKRVIVAAPYAAYVEFGTGSRVFDNKVGFTFRPEIKEFAKEFYVSGLGRMPSRPYLFPPFEAEKLEILKRIKNELKI